VVNAGWGKSGDFLAGDGLSFLKKYLPRRRWKRVMIYLFGALVVLLALDMALLQYGRWITIGVETTRVTSPITAQGYPDYVAVLNEELSKGVTEGNNAARLLVRVMPADKRTEIFGKNVLPR